MATTGDGIASSFTDMFCGSDSSSCVYGVGIRPPERPGDRVSILRLQRPQAHLPIIGRAGQDRQAGEE